MSYWNATACLNAVSVANGKIANSPFHPSHVPQSVHPVGPMACEAARRGSHPGQLVGAAAGERSCSSGFAGSAVHSCNDAA